MQNFYSHLSVLAMLVVYAVMVSAKMDVDLIIILCGVFVSGTMYLVMRKHAANQREFGSLGLTGEQEH